MKRSPSRRLSAGVALVTFLAIADALRAEPLFQQTDVFVSGKDGYVGYRIPAIETAPDGSLLAFAEARKYNLGDPGYDGNDIDLVVKQSRDLGATWSPMRVIEDPGEKWSAANPATVVDRSNGRLWLFYLRCKPGRGTDAARPGTDDSQILARTSDNSGASWSEPIDLTAVSRDMADPKWRCTVIGPGGGIQTRDGRLALPAWRFEPFGVFAFFSTDHGKTWQRGGVVPDVAGDECQLVEMADGRLLLDIRQQSGPTRWCVASQDGGKTWSPRTPGVKVTPVACAVERLPWKARGPEGDRILWTGPRAYERSDLVVRVSRDQGQAFPVERAVRTVATGPAAYSDLAVLGDETVGLLWERGVDQGYQFITFTRFDREWLDQPEPPAAPAPR